jgi:2-dehydro-3-deoxyphosphogluconate aldolase / (4S)-4-hydroxy-2-oxoglutarate aldolase
MTNAAAAADFFATRLAATPVIAILRGSEPRAAVRLADACWDAGIELVEVSLSHDRDLTSMRAVCHRSAERGRMAGAGTVCTADEVRAAAAAGASFAVGPGLDPGTVAAAQAVALPYLPGVATPSEVQAALAIGCRTMKLFPAAALGSRWIRDLSGPFPIARFVAVGGITDANAREFLDAGAIGVGLASALQPQTLRTLVASLRS